MPKYRFSRGEGCSVAPKPLETKPLMLDLQNQGLTCGLRIPPFRGIKSPLQHLQ